MCSTNTYNRLMQYNHIILKSVIEKWSKKLNEDIPTETLERGFKTLMKSQESAYTLYIQFKVLHSQVMTNIILFQIGIIELDKCTR